MLLTIDIGNTNVTIGLYVDRALGPRWRLATDHQRMSDEYGLTLVGLLSHTGYRAEQVDAEVLQEVAALLHPET